MTFEEAAQLFERLSIEVTAAIPQMTSEGAKIIEKEAKDELGTYQPAIGPFDAWAPLSDRTKAERVRLGYTPDDPLLRSGQLRDSIKTISQPNGTAVVGTDLDYAVDLENGTSRIPPRPFLSRAAFVKQNEILDAQTEILLGIYQRK